MIDGNPAPSGKKCRLCGLSKIELVKKSDLQTALGSNDFRITDYNYGKTLDLYKCGDCAFLQCLDTSDIEHYYEGLQDAEYENTRGQRSLQAKKILCGLKNYSPAGKMVDVGAGSGIFVEQAMALGYDALGVEPSVWLQQKAVERNLPVLLGILPHERIQGPYDVAILVDVIEHVDDPVGLLQSIKSILKDGGLLLLTTPDAGSFFARILGWKWWHYRVAHINYFNSKTMKLLLDKAGFEIVKIKRPNWYFTLSYLLERICSYLPESLRFKMPDSFNKVIVPLNLFDSYEIICRAKLNK